MRVEQHTHEVACVLLHCVFSQDHIFTPEYDYHKQEEEEEEVDIQMRTNSSVCVYYLNIYFWPLFLKLIVREGCLYVSIKNVN